MKDVLLNGRPLFINQRLLNPVFPSAQFSCLLSFSGEQVEPCRWFCFVLLKKGWAFLWRFLLGVKCAPFFIFNICQPRELML